MSYYAQHGEDRIIDSLGILPERGVYVDVGCHLPYLHNSTAFLHEKGWTGVSIDALDYSECYDRPFVQAVVSSSDNVRFRYNCNSLLARVCDEGEMVRALPLRNILAEHNIGAIDFLALDVEGHEFEVFDSMEWELHRPKVVMFEYLTAAFDGPDVEDRRLHELLRALGYRSVLDNGMNCVAVL